jgi:hypothetical protein
MMYLFIYIYDVSIKNYVDLAKLNPGRPIGIDAKGFSIDNEGALALIV